MRNLRSFPLAGALLAVIFLAGCGSSGIDDILGGGTGTGSSNQLQGTVDYVDTNSRFISLTNVDNYGNYLRNGANSARLYFDNSTTVEYQGRSYRPEDLERGDQIAATVSGNSDRLVADRITVLRDVGSGTSGTYGSLVRGAVTYIDTRSRILELDRSSYGSRDVVRLSYDANTSVSYQGRTYRVEDLERGDVVEVDTRDLGSGRLMAQQIRVVQNVGSNDGYGGTTGQSDLRGTVRYVDTSGRMIELERPSWGSRFSTGDGSAGTVVVRYDSSTIVEYQGKTYTASNLERGDVIEVRLRSTNTSTPYADRIYVVSDSRAF